MKSLIPDAANHPNPAFAALIMLSGNDYRAEVTAVTQTFGLFIPKEMFDRGWIELLYPESGPILMRLRPEGIKAARVYLEFVTALRPCPN